MAVIPRDGKDPMTVHLVEYGGGRHLTGLVDLATYRKPIEEAAGG